MSKLLDVVIIDAVIFLEAFERARPVVNAVTQTTRRQPACIVMRALLNLVAAVVEQATKDLAVIIINLLFLLDSLPPAVRAWLFPFATFPAFPVHVMGFLLPFSVPLSRRAQMQHAGEKAEQE